MQDHSHDSGWLGRLNDLQKLLAAIAAVVVPLGALGTAAYVARDSWEKAFGAGSGPATPTPGPASPPPHLAARRHHFQPGLWHSRRIADRVGRSRSYECDPAARHPSPPDRPPLTAATGHSGHGRISSVASSGGSCAWR